MKLRTTRSTKRSRAGSIWTVVSVLALAILACGPLGGGTVPQPQAVDTVPPPPSAAPTQAVPPTNSGGKATTTPPTTEPESLPDDELILDDPTYGTLSLDNGFTPDPATIDVVSGGPVNVREYIGLECAGYAAPPPDVSLEWKGSGPLRVYFVAEGAGDTTLIVNDATGAFHCNDDHSSNTLDPMVEFADAESGRIDIWVGNIVPGDNASGTLYITELDYSPDELPGQLQAVPPGSTELLFGEPSFGTISLASFFSPDPTTREVASGGDVNVSYLGSGCLGFAAPNPDLSLNWEGSGFLRIFFVGDGDTTLIINDALANWHCSDDFESTIHPGVDFVDAQPGRYDIWVGSFNPGETISGALYFTELDYDPGNLP